MCFRRFVPRFLACLFALGTVSPFALAQNNIGEAIDLTVQEALKAWQVPGIAVAVVHGDRTIFLKGFGVKTLGRPDAVTADTLFPLASCTKGFTTAVMAMLVDEGKMAWDDPVRQHVPFFHLADPNADKLVCLRDLVTHRTGVGSHDLLWYRSPWSEEELIRRIGRVPLSRPFRGAFQYQTIMFNAAGYAVGHAAGETWQNVVQKRLLDPLGMTGTRFTTAFLDEKTDYATPHRKNKDGRVDAIPWYRMDAPNSAGSLHASARDAAKWVQFQMGEGVYQGKRLVSAQNLLETRQPQTIIRLEGPTKLLNPETTQLSYGMAWVVQDYRGHWQAAHAGLIDGFRTQITLLPNAKLGLVLMNNLHGNRMNLALSNSLVDLLLGLPPRDWNGYFSELTKQEEAAAKASREARDARRAANATPAHPLLAYCGDYQDPAYGQAWIVQENNSLMWIWNSFRVPLLHLEADTFILNDDNLGQPLAVFGVNKAGAIDRLRINEIEFQKAAGR